MLVWGNGFGERTGARDTRGKDCRAEAANLARRARDGNAGTGGIICTKAGVPITGYRSAATGGRFSLATGHGRSAAGQNGRRKWAGVCRAPPYSFILPRNPTATDRTLGKTKAVWAQRRTWRYGKGSPKVPTAQNASPLPRQLLSYFQKAKPHLL